MVGCHGKIRVSCLIVTREMIAINARRGEITMLFLLVVHGVYIQLVGEGRKNILLN